MMDLTLSTALIEGIRVLVLLYLVSSSALQPSLLFCNEIAAKREVKCLSNTMRILRTFDGGLQMKILEISMHSMLL